ncbi:TPA: YjcZ family sporulation protein [Bacillus toyonensis]|uniref:Sporulation protein YjcZ n=1 Tax=Bacillus thuringiensis TaxID=1428 RepID=A0A9X7AST2_BACTU|nr:hypothetical protein COK72_01265 [Bacillus thuringiensis]HDR7950712.1 YjcZ family sporulation protein [Bacillus toyonensis]
MGYSGSCGEGCGFARGFALLVVLFILLIIIGCIILCGKSFLRRFQRWVLKFDILLPIIK